MGEGLGLDGTMIPRRVRRMFDQRAEPRVTLPLLGQIEWRDRASEARTANLSASGAMIECDAELSIGERVVLTLPGDAPRPAVVRWLRGGLIGLHFTASVG